LHTRTLVIGFNEPLYQQTAENVNNYHIVGGKYGVLRDRAIKAIYNATDDTVRVSLRSPISLNGRSNLVIVGTGPNGVTDTSGRLLDGGHSGLPGSEFVTNLNKRTVHVTRAHPVAPRACLSQRKNRV
jgi:hypothetical protein